RGGRVRAALPRRPPRAAAARAHARHRHPGQRARVRPLRVPGPRLEWLTGGTGGWRVGQASMFGLQMDSSKHLMGAYVVLLALFCLVALLLVNLHDSGAGRRFRAIRDSELAAATMGVNLTRYKLLAFGMSAAIAGMGGSFYPLVAGSVSPQPFWLFTSLQFAAIAVLMGVRYVPAAALGGAFMAFVPDVLTRYGHGTLFGRPYEISYDWFQIAVGVLLIVQLITLPDGVWGDLRQRVLHMRSAVGGLGGRKVKVACRCCGCATSRCASAESY